MRGPRNILLAFFLGMAATAFALAPPPSEEDIATEMAAMASRVVEFDAIGKEATRRGLRVWLFGGTAAAYAHYARWTLLARAETPGLQSDRFDDDFTNIFRSNQDLDLVVDGPMEQLVALEEWITKTFPYAQGNKSDWELRHLRIPRGTKLPIDGKDFLEQHSDSHSTAKFELTEPPPGETRLRDLRDPDGRPPVFLRDVAATRLHFYFSKTHESTVRAREGKNPPILAAIRYLTKAFQYELAVRDEDLALIEGFVRSWDPHSVIPGSYVDDWIERNATKLLQNAVNIEYAWNVLEKLGLRKKLMALHHDAGRIGTLAWWMQREPLPSFEVGQGSGATAASLELDVVTHETTSFLAHESITRAHSGLPNVFLSRPNAVCEAAVHGTGFYTRVGTEGARGTKIKIRFHLKPHAREGKDFTYVRHAGFVVVHNKNALEVIPESLKLSPMEYLELLLNDETLPDNERALVEKFRRRTRGRLRLIPDDERASLEEKLVAFAVEKHATPLAEYVRMFGGIPDCLRARFGRLTQNRRIQFLHRLADQPSAYAALRPLLDETFAHLDASELTVAEAQGLLELHAKVPIPADRLWEIWNRIPPEEWRRYPEGVWNTLVAAKKIPADPPNDPGQALTWTLRHLARKSKDTHPNDRNDNVDLERLYHLLAQGIPEPYAGALYRSLEYLRAAESWKWAVIRRAGHYGPAFFDYLGYHIPLDPFPRGEALRKELSISEGVWDREVEAAIQRRTARHLGTNLAAHVRPGSQAARAHAARQYAFETSPHDRDQIVGWVLRNGGDSPEFLEAVLASDGVAGSPLWEHYKYLAPYLESDERALALVMRMTGNDQFYDKNDGYRMLCELFTRRPDMLDVAWKYRPKHPWESRTAQRYARALLRTTPAQDVRRGELALAVLRAIPDNETLGTANSWERENSFRTIDDAIRVAIFHPRRRELSDVLTRIAQLHEGKLARDTLKEFLPTLDEELFRAILSSEKDIDVTAIPGHGSALVSHPQRAVWMTKLMAERATSPVPWARLAALTFPSDPWRGQLVAEVLAIRHVPWTLAEKALALLEPGSSLPDVAVDALLTYVGGGQLFAHFARAAKLVPRLHPGRPDLETRIRALADQGRAEKPHYPSEDYKVGMAALDATWKRMRTDRLGPAPLRWCAAALRGAGLLPPERAVPRAPSTNGGAN